MPDLWCGLQDQVAHPEPVEVPGGGQAGLPAADHDDVDPLGGGRDSAPRSTAKLHLIPLRISSAMWQCALPLP